MFFVFWGVCVCVCVCQGDRLIDVQHVLFVAGFDGYELFVFVGTAMFSFFIL